MANSQGLKKKVPGTKPTQQAVVPKESGKMRPEEAQARLETLRSAKTLSNTKRATQARTSYTPTGRKSGGITPEEWDNFLELLVDCAGNVVRACELAKLSRTVVYERRAVDEDFERRYQEAKARGVDSLEDEATRRAHDGVERGVYHQGIRVGAERVYSDTLMCLLLKANRPEKYKEVSETRVVNPNATGPDFSGISDDELDAIIARGGRA